MEKENSLPNCTTHTSYSVLSNFLLSVATYHQHLRKKFSYHNPYIMPELAKTMLTFCAMLDILHLALWNKVMLEHDVEIEFFME